MEEGDGLEFLTPELVDILKRVHRVVHNNVMSLRFMNIVFKRIDFANQKGSGAQPLPDCPSLLCKKKISLQIRLN